MIPRILAALAAAAVTLAPPAAAIAQSVGSAAAPGGLTFQQARAKYPRLTRVTFDKADSNGDGVIEGRELPILQSMYEQLYQNR